MFERLHASYRERLRKGCTIGGITIFREVPGVVGPGYQWIIFEDEYMYNDETLLRVLVRYVKEYRADKHMIG